MDSVNTKLFSILRFVISLSVLALVACKSRSAFGDEPADTILVNGRIASTFSDMPYAKCMAIQRGKIVAIGSLEECEKHADSTTNYVDLQNRWVSPGLCDSHLHFVGLGVSLQRIDLRAAANWDEVIEMVAAKADKLPVGTWIEGRGWHQSKWNKTPQPSLDGYPIHDELSKRIPKHPVLLTHASGHAAFANDLAMKRAGIDNETIDPDGGEIVRDNSGNAIGLFRENAQSLLYSAMAKESSDSDQSSLQESIQLAGQECLKHGITSVHDAGISFSLADTLQSMASRGTLPVRMNVMIRASTGELVEKMQAHAWDSEGDGFLRCRSVKLSLDGALGPHGAWLLDPYQDLQNSVGLNTLSLEDLSLVAQLCKKRKWQLCVHAIGDKANRETLNVFEKILGSDAGADHRWRIEHAQHIHPEDLPRFKSLGVIPAMQANHCTSDAIFVLERLGERRASENAYQWRALIDSGCIIPNGTDAPVELVDPRASLYASVTRKPKNTVPFFPQQCMTRQEALLSYTLWPAIAAFNEKTQGSLEIGKEADFVIWDRDLLTCSEDEILEANAIETWVHGISRYRSQK